MNGYPILKNTINNPKMSYQDLQIVYPFFRGCGILISENQ